MSDSKNQVSESMSHDGSTFTDQNEWQIDQGRIAMKLSEHPFMAESGLN